MASSKIKDQKLILIHAVSGKARKVIPGSFARTPAHMTASRRRTCSPCVMDTVRSETGGVYLPPIRNNVSSKPWLGCSLSGKRSSWGSRRIRRITPTRSNTNSCGDSKGFFRLLPGKRPRSCIDAGCHGGHTARGTSSVLCLHSIFAVVVKFLENGVLCIATHCNCVMEL